MSAPSPPGATSAASGGPIANGLLGLDAEETALLGALLGETAPAGVDGTQVVERLARGLCLAEALALPAGLPDLLYAHAHAWFAAGRHDRAEGLFRALCILDGTVADHWLGHGICLRLVGALREAGLAFATAVALRPGWAVAHFHAASLAAAVSDWGSVAGHLDAYECARARAPEATSDNMAQDAARLRLAISRRGGAGPRAAQE